MLIDWIACTVASGAPAVTEWFKKGLPGPWLALDHAPGRHTRTMRCGGVAIYTDAPNDESIHIVVSGKGCRELEAAGMVTGWPDFLARLLRGGASFSRLDVAIDDKDGLLKMDDILACCQGERVVTRYKKIISSEERHKDTGAVMGRQVTFGTRQSDSLVRIYDKALKQGVAGHWIRVELEARNQRAQAVARAIGNKGGGVPGILLSCLNFKECGSSVRRDRWPTAAWWTSFLGTNQRFQLETAPRNESLEKSHRWLIKQASRAFANVHDSGLYDTLIDDLLAQGRQKRDGKPSKTTQKSQAPGGETAPNSQFVP